MSMPIDPKDISIKSPCFVHSHLDKGASLQDWLHAKEKEVLGADVGVAKSLQQHNQQPVELPCPEGGIHALSGNDEDDQYGGSLTKQLAETAVGVREMSKQLGECMWSLDILSTQQTLLQDVLE
jgi:NAD+ kinase